MNIEMLGKFVQLGLIVVQSEWLPSRFGGR